MSSDYSIFCLLHDPAIEVIDNVPSVDEAQALVARGFSHHQECDLILARYSGALIEVGCPGSTPDATRGLAHRGHGGYHRDTTWADAKLLRVAAAANKPTQDVLLRKALDRLDGWCWDTQRLHRLRYVLDAVPSPQEDA